MIIRTRCPMGKSRTVQTMYYKYMGSNGLPTLGPKRGAAQFSREVGETVLRHLQIIDRRFANAELVDS